MSVNFPLPAYVDQESTRNRNFRTLKANYGNGVSQRAPDGLNAKLDSWEVVWVKLTPSEQATVEAALDAAGCWDIILWTPPNESVEKKFVMREPGYSLRYDGILAIINCVLDQV